jgi:hypothetical protein
VGLPSFENVAAGVVGNVAGGMSVSDAVHDGISTATSGVKATLQQAWADQTSDAATEQRVQQGAQDAGDLVTHGFDPGNPADQQKMIGAIAGGLALIPGPGPLLAGALEGMYQLGNALAPVLNKLWPTGCWHTGPNTKPGDIMQMWPRVPGNTGKLPPMPSGSFAELVMNALAAAEADTFNCKNPPGPATIVAGLAQMWNNHASGPPVDVFVPALSLMFGTGGVDTSAITREVPGHGFMFDGVDPPPFLSQQQLAHAFQPIASVPSYVQDLVSPSAVEGTRPAVLHLKGSSLSVPPPAPPAPKIVHVLALTLRGLSGQVAAKTAAPPAVATVALKKVLTLHMHPTPAAAAAVNVSSPAAKAVLGAANKAIISAPAFWVAYYARKAQQSPLPRTHPYAVIIARDLARQT